MDEIGATDCQGRFGALVSLALDCCEEFVRATQMYGDSDLSLTSTPLVDERVPTTQPYADDLPPVSFMPPPPVPKRTFTGVQRSSVDSGVVAGGSLNRADSTRGRKESRLVRPSSPTHTLQSPPLSCGGFGSLASRHIKSRVL